MGSEDQSISWRCATCGEEAANPRHHLEAVAGFAQPVKWLAVEPGPDLAEPLLLDKAPVAGEEHWLWVRFPFTAVADEPFWCLYQPPLSVHNGWDDQPQEIAACAIVECRLLAVKNREANTAKARVSVLRSISLPEIADQFGPEKGTGDMLGAFTGDRAWTTCSDRFSHLSCSFEGDLGYWAIVEHRKDGDYLLLDGDWSWHRDDFRLQNRRLSPAEAAIMAALKSGAGR